MASQKLFNDSNLIGKKGNLLVFKNTNGVNYMSTSALGERHITIYGLGDKLMVGSTYLDEPIDPKLDEVQFEKLHRSA
jgi:hypothetical protein